MTLPPHVPIPSGAPGGDPSMDDILASIRRILSEDDAQTPGTAQAATQPALPAAAPSPPRSEPDDVLVLDASMMIPEPPAPDPPRPMPDNEPAKEAKVEDPPPLPPPAPVPPPAAPTLVAPEAAAGVATSVSALMRTLASERSTAVHRGGPTIEDLVREELRPLLKEWLDLHLPPIVERAVRAEIERVVGRAVS